MKCVICKIGKSDRWYGKRDNVILCRKCYRKKPIISTVEKQAKAMYRKRNRKSINNKKKNNIKIT